MSESKSVPGIRPDKATVVCNNCGHKFSPKGNPCNVHPNAQVPAKCPDCPVNATVIHNEFSYISGTYGDVSVVDETDEVVIR